MQTQNICITFVQCQTNVEDVGLTLYKCYTNVLCLPGYIIVVMGKVLPPMPLVAFALTCQKEDYIALCKKFMLKIHPLYYYMYELSIPGINKQPGAKSPVVQSS